MHRRHKCALAGLAVATLLTSGTWVGTAFARGEAPIARDKIALGEDEVKQLVLLMDRDKNGKVSEQEFMNFMQAEFSRLDKDKSGELDVKELASGRLMGSAATREEAAPRRDTIALGEDEVKQLVLLMDRDQNGRVSEQEFMYFMKAEFKRLDMDKSGELDVKELKGSQIRVSHFTAFGK